ncbi:MAG: sporulation protein, partial [Methylotenera sp.]
QQKASEIKALGVEELFIVQDSQWRNAISFGLFQDEQLASNLLTELQAKGVKGATKALRSPGKALSSLLVKAVSAQTALELQKIKPEFVGTELAPATCPA